jgi:hypothetical protein
MIGTAILCQERNRGIKHEGSVSFRSGISCEMAYMSRKTSPKRDYARTVCDALTKTGAPDLYNSVAKRPVTLDEAKSYGWHMFYDGVTACSRGHLAARYVVNPAMCSDCNRVNNGKVAIYPNADGSDLTAPVTTYVDPVAQSEFRWTPALTDQFFTAYKNTASVGTALEKIKAQFSHLLDRMASDAEFKAKFERVKAEDVAQVQLWITEALGVSGSERAALQQFAPIRAKNDLGARNVRSPEQLNARSAARLQRLIDSDRCFVGDRAEVLETVFGVRKTRPEDADVGAGGVGSGPVGRGISKTDDPNSDLVS